MTIMAAGIPLGAGGKSEIVVLCNNTINTAVNGIVVLLSPSDTSKGEHNASNKPSTAVGSSVSYQPLVDGLGTCTSLSHELNNPGTCVASSHQLGKLGNCTHSPTPPLWSAGGVQVVGTPNTNVANNPVVGGSNHIWLLKDKPGTRANLSFELVEPGAWAVSEDKLDKEGTWAC
jgi:hypothetical protein